MEFLLNNIVAPTTSLIIIKIKSNPNIDSHLIGWYISLNGVPVFLYVCVQCGMLVVASYFAEDGELN